MTCGWSRRDVTAAVASLLLASGTGACGPSTVNCTLAGCFDQLTVTLVAPDWEPGEYVIVLEPRDATAERPAVRCQVSLPNTGGLESAPCGPETDGPQPYLVVGTGLSVTGLRSDHTPATVRLTRDGQPLLETTVDPEYEAFYPNGEACGGPCFNASVVLEVPTP